MRLAALLAALALAAPASPVEDYLAARDKAAAAIAAMEDANADSAKIDAADDAALKELEKRLAPIVGPVAVKGFTAKPKINLVTLSKKQMGFGMLDGLALAPSPDPQDQSELIATTKPLLHAWLTDRSAEPEFRVPAELEKALRESDFYTGAFGSDAAFGYAGEIEIAKPASADFAFAGFGRRAQIEDPTPLDRVVVAVVKGDRVLLADMPAVAKLPEYPACKPIWAQAQAKGEALAKAYPAGGQKDDKLDKASLAATAEGSRAWLACEGERAKSRPTFANLKKQAQGLADRMAGG